MASYKAYQKRKENATPFADQAVCRKCKYGEYVKTSAFCSGFGRPKKIRDTEWYANKVGYCTQFIPKSDVRVV